MNQDPRNPSIFNENATQGRIQEENKSDAPAQNSGILKVSISFLSIIFPRVLPPSITGNFDPPAELKFRSLSRYYPSFSLVTPPRTLPTQKRNKMTPPEDSRCRKPRKASWFLQTKMKSRQDWGNWNTQSLISENPQTIVVKGIVFLPVD